IISSTDYYMDEVSWTLTNASNVVIASASDGDYLGNPAGTHTITVPAVDGPYTFFIETNGTFNDNTPEYTINCNGSTILNGTMAGGTTLTESGLICGGDGIYTYSWSPTDFLNDPTIADP